MEWDVVFRVLNAAGCVFALYFLANSAYRQWSTWNIKTQTHWWALVGWIFVGLEGAIESAVLRATPGPRIIIQSLVVAWTITALLRPGELKAEAPRKSWRTKDE